MATKLESNPLKKTKLFIESTAALVFSFSAVMILAGIVDWVLA
jgi:hypothetical protein